MRDSTPRPVAQKRLSRPHGLLKIGNGMALVGNHALIFNLGVSVSAYASRV
jgi:hypothetical protein